MFIPHTNTHTLELENFQDVTELYTARNTRDIQHPVIRRAIDEITQEWIYYEGVYDLDSIIEWVNRGGGDPMTRARMDWNTLEEVRWTIKPDSLPDSYWRETRTLLDHLRRGGRVAGIQPRQIIRVLPPPIRFVRRQPRMQTPSDSPPGVTLQRRFHDMMGLNSDDYLQIMQQSRAYTRNIILEEQAADTHRRGDGQPP
jgi:hypothetical protein